MSRLMAILGLALSLVFLSGCGQKSDPKVPKTEAMVEDESGEPAMEPHEDIAPANNQGQEIMEDSGDPDGVISEEDPSEESVEDDTPVEEDTETE